MHNRIDPQEVERVKREARERDDARLASGEVTAAELTRENSWLSAEWQPDWDNAPRL
jgi:hypothetical protein